MEMKMTAIEWLMTELSMGLKITIANKLQKAKAIEKEQIIKAYDSGGDHYTDFGAPIWGVDYYNETYGK